MYRALLRLLLLAPLLGWTVIAVLGTVDVPETASLFHDARSALHEVMTDI